MIIAYVNNIKIQGNMRFRNVVWKMERIAKMWREIKMIQLNPMAMCPSNSIKTWKVPENSNKIFYPKQRDGWVWG